MVVFLLTCGCGVLCYHCFLLFLYCSYASAERSSFLNLVSLVSQEYVLYYSLCGGLKSYNRTGPRKEIISLVRTENEEVFMRRPFVGWFGFGMPMNVKVSTSMNQYQDNLDCKERPIYPNSID